MRYFARELHGRVESDYSTSMPEFERLCSLYREQLLLLQPRLSPEAWRFFDCVSLHDGTLLVVRTGDDVGKQFTSLSTRLTNYRRPVVEVEALNYQEDELFRLRYERIHRFAFDFPSPNPWYLRYDDRGSNPIDDWMCDELSAVDDKVLRHEVLFSSGATLLIDFESISVQSTRIEGREDLPYLLDSGESETP